MNGKRIILILIGLVLVGYLGYWYLYKRSMDMVNDAWYESEYVGKQIDGVLTSLNEYENNPHKVVLSIDNEGEEFNITYGVTCVDSVFRNFVQVGDLIYKNSDSKEIKFCKTESSNLCKEFELNFCGKFE